MSRLSFPPAPNPRKIVLVLDETGMSREIVPAGTCKGEQNAPAVRALIRERRSAGHRGHDVRGGRQLPAAIARWFVLQGGGAVAHIRRAQTVPRAVVEAAR